MVEIRLRRDSRSRLSFLSASGHAGWAENGEDVVCAAVSALVQSAWLGLTEIAGIPVAASKAAGRLDLRWDPALSDRDDVRAIVETVARSLRIIAGQYPEHVRVVEDGISPPNTREPERRDG